MLDAQQAEAALELVRLHVRLASVRVGRLARRLLAALVVRRQTPGVQLRGQAEGQLEQRQIAEKLVQPFRGSVAAPRVQRGLQ